MAIINIVDLFSDKDKANFSFIFKNKIKSPNGNFIDSPMVVTVDATTEENYTLDTTITDNEVQDGFTLVDHIHTLPQKVVVNCIISEVPIVFLPTALRDVAEGGFQAVSGSTSSNVLSPILGSVDKYFPQGVSGLASYSVFGNASNRVDVQRNFWQNFLKARRNAKDVFKIQSDVDTIENVFFENITFNRTYDIGDSLVFTATLKEIRIISSNVVRTDLSPFSHNPANLGQVTGKVVDSVVDSVSNLFPSLPFWHKTSLKKSITPTFDQAKKSVTGFLKGLF